MTMTAVVFASFVVTCCSCVGPLVRHRAIVSRQSSGRFVAVLAAFLLATDRPMQPLELLQPPLEGPGIGDNGAIRERGQRLDAQVDTDRRATVRWYRLLVLHLDRDVPVP